MQQGHVVVSDNGSGAWEQLTSDTRGSKKPVSARYASNQIADDKSKLVTLAATPTSQDDGKYVQYSDGAYRLVRASAMLVVNAGTTGATGPAGLAVVGVAGATGQAGTVGVVGATGPRGQRGATGQQGQPSGMGAQGPTGASVVGDQGTRGATGPARAALATQVSSVTVRRASIVVVPGVPSAGAATYSLPADFAVAPDDAFKAVYTDGELTPRSGGWSPGAASTMTLTLAPGVYGVWALGVSSDTPTLSWTLRATTSVGEITLHVGAGETVPKTTYREYVLDACAWPAAKLMLDVTACTNLRVYFRLVPVAPLVPDTAPVIAFSPSAMYHVYGQPYQEYGVTCHYDVGDTRVVLTPTRSPAITASTSVGVYDVEYSATNAKGTTTVKRTVHVIEQPVLARTGADPLTRYKGDPLNDPGCTVDTKGVSMQTAVVVSGAPATDGVNLTTVQKSTMTYTLSYTVGGVKYPTFADRSVTRVVDVVVKPEVFNAMVTGHAFRTEIKFVPSVGETSVLGLMQYTRYGRLFTSIGTNDHYGTSGQWIQAPDGISTPSGSWPWGSIEGGFFVSDKMGGVRYHVAASSHRYNNRSDTLGGFGFYEQGLPFKYLARVVLSERLLLPPYGVCFPMADEGKLFGAGWIALPLFEFPSTAVAKDPLTWTFFADAENFSGPVCCYPPQFWVRRLASWAALRLGEDKSLPAAYGTTDQSIGLAFSGPRAGEIYMGVSGEIPNMKCAFATGDPRGSIVWKVPEIRMPAAGAWLADASFFTERNFAQLKSQFASRSALTLLPKSATLLSGAEFHVGVKRVVEVGVTEIDDVLGIDARVDRSDTGDAYVVSGADAGKTLGRYYVETSTIKDTITNGTGKQDSRRVCVPASSSGPITLSEYASGSKAVAFKNADLEAYVAARAKNGIETVTLEDGTKVRYGLMRFVEQPAIASLAVDFPDDFSAPRLAELQSRFETLTKTNFSTQTRRSAWTNSLVRVDPNMLITPVAGYVPVAVGSEPAGGGVAGGMYTATW